MFGLRWWGPLPLPWRKAPPQAVYLGDHTLLARTAYGNAIYLDSRDLSLTPSVALKGEWERGIVGAFRQAVRPGMRIVDLGANCGVYSLVAARRTGPRGKVTAIDANPRMVELLRKSFQANNFQDRAAAIHGAVADRPGEVQLGIPDDFLGSASMLIRPHEDDGRIATFTAPADTLDAWLGDDLSVDVLKIDCEGAEPLIWDGAEAVLAANRRICIFMEFAPAMIAEQTPPADFIARIRAQGFSVARVHEHSGVVTPLTDEALLARRWTELRLLRA